MHCLVVEDQQILLDLLATIVDAFSGISTISKATTCAQTITISKGMPVDLAILDLHLTDGDGNELGQRLVQSNPSIRLIVLTGAPEDFRFSHELRGSIHALIDKRDSFDALHHRLSTILQPAHQRLTPRQSEIFELICAGKSTKEIAYFLNSATSTIESHRKAIALEINQPMSILRLTAQRLQHQLHERADPAQLLEALQILDDQASRISRTTDQMKAIIRNANTSLSRIDLRDVLDSIQLYVNSNLIEASRWIKPSLPSELKEQEAWLTSEDQVLGRSEAIISLPLTYEPETMRLVVHRDFYQQPVIARW